MKKIFHILLLTTLITSFSSCAGYKPIFNSPDLNFEISKYELTGNKKYFDSIDKSICSANDSINRSNFSHCSLYLATPSSIIRKKIVIIRCNKEDIKKYQSKLFKINNIKDSIYFISNDISNLVAGVSDKISRGEFTAYICENSVCSEPVDDIQKLCDLLSK